MSDKMYIQYPIGKNKTAKRRGRKCGWKNVVIENSELKNSKCFSWIFIGFKSQTFTRAESLCCSCFCCFSFIYLFIYFVYSRNTYHSLYDLSLRFSKPFIQLVRNVFICQRRVQSSNDGWKLKLAIRRRLYKNYQQRQRNQNFRSQILQI